MARSDTSAHNHTQTHTTGVDASNVVIAVLLLLLPVLFLFLTATSLFVAIHANSSVDDATSSSTIVGSVDVVVVFVVIDDPFA